MSKFIVIRVDTDKSDTHAATTYRAAVALANADAGSILYYAVVEAADAGAARIMPARFKRFEACEDCGRPTKILDTKPLITECTHCDITVAHA